MEIFLDILVRLIPLYIFILVGYIAGKYLKIDRTSLASFLIQIVVPIVIFRGIFLTEINYKTLSYPLFYFFASILMSTSFYFFGKYKYDLNKAEAALLSMACSLSNVGFFGMPLVLILLGNEVLGTVVLITLGFTLHENILTYFLVLKGVSGTKNAIKRTLRLPVLYAAVIGIIMNQFYYKFYLISFPDDQTKYLHSVIEVLIKSMDYFVNILIVMGTIMVGLSLSQINKIKFKWDFLKLSLIAQFIIYPFLALLFIYLNQQYLFFYQAEALQIIFLLSLVPIGSNTITIASRLKLDNGSLAFAVVLSTVLSLFIIPFAVVLFGKYF